MVAAKISLSVGLGGINNQPHGGWRGETGSGKLAKARRGRLSCRGAACLIARKSSSRRSKLVTTRKQVSTLTGAVP